MTTEAYRKRHSQPQHSRNYSRTYARDRMKQFITEQRRLQQGKPIRREESQ